MPGTTITRQTQHRAAVAPGERASWLAHLLWLAILFLAFLATAAAGVITSNWRELVRRAIVVAAREQTHRPVTLGAFGVSRTGRVSLTDLTVHTSATDRAPLFALDRLDVDIDVPALLASPRHAARAVKRVRAIRPYVLLERDADGRTNIDDLLRRPPPRKRTKNEFGAAIDIVDGEVIYRDGRGLPPTIGPIDEHLTALNVRVLPSADGYLPFHLSARTATGHVREIELTGGVQADRRHIQADIRFDTVDLAFVQRFIPCDLGITLLGGEASGRWELTLAPHPQTGRLRPTMAIVADVNSARGLFALSGRSLPFAIDAGRLRLSNDGIELSDVRGYTRGVPMTISGSISHFGDPVHLPVLGLQITTAKADAQTLQTLIPGLSDLPMTLGGTLDGWVQLTGSTNGPHALAVVRGPSVHSEFGDLDAVEAQMSWSDGMLTMTRVRARAFDGDVTGNAWLAYSKDGVKALFQGEARKTSLARVLAPSLAKAPPPPPDMPSLSDLHGTVSGPVAVSLENERLTILARGAGTMGLGTITAGVGDVSVKLESADDQTRLVLERVALETPEGRFQASGAVEADGNVHLAVRGSRLCLANVGTMVTRATKTAMPALDGTGFLTGELTGPADALTFDGTIQARDGKFQTYRFQKLTAHVSAVAAPLARVIVDGVHLVMGNSQVVCRGELAQQGTGPDARWQASGKMTLPLTSMSALKASLGMDLPLDGFVDGDVTLQESDLEHPVGQGGFVLRRPVLTAGGTRLALDSVTVNFTLRGQTITLANTVMVYHGVPFTIDGTVDFAPNATQGLALHVRCDALNLDNLTTLADGDGKHDLLTDDGNVRLPVDVNGDFAFTADITAALTPGKGETVQDAVARTCQVRARLESDDTLTVGSIPYQHLALRAAYAVGTSRLTVDTFALGRATTSGSYALALARPGTVDFAANTLDVALRFGAVKAPQMPANLDLVRRDLVTIADHTDNASPLAPLLNGARGIPVPFAGAGQAEVTLGARLSAPRVDAIFTVADLTIANRPVPDLAGRVNYDVAAQRLNIARFVATDRDDRASTASLAGSIDLPAYDLAGKVTRPGTLRLTFATQKLRPKLLAAWAPYSILAQMDGEATVRATLQGPTSDPDVRASLVMDRFRVGPYAFDTLAADLALQHGVVTIGGEKHAALHFARAATTPDIPLECWGTLPLAWLGPMQPIVPPDGKMDLHVRLPRQGLDALRAFAPTLPTGDGTLEAALDIDGTPAQPLIKNGAVRADAPMLTLDWGKNDNPDLPNRLTNVAVDLAFHSDVVGGERVNVVEVNDLSTGYDRITDPPKPVDYGKTSLKSALARAKAFQPLKWAKQKLGVDKPKPYPKGALVAQGSITLPYSEGTRLTLDELPSLLRYDVYAKTVRTPVRFFDNFLQGRVSGYLHLGNTTVEGKNTPLLSGVVYAENTTITVKGVPSESDGPGGGSVGPDGEAWKPYYVPFNPRLSIAVQSGEHNKFLFDMAPTPVSAEIPFTTTQSVPADGVNQPLGLSRIANETLLTPISVDDQHFLAAATGAKPFIDRGNFAYAYNADTLRAGFVTGTYGWLWGTLLRPNFDAEYTALPRRARVRLPGGVLSVETATGHLHLPMNRPIGVVEDPDTDIPSLTVTAQATGTMNQVSVAAEMSDANLFQLDKGRLPITFTATSVPAGTRPPSSDEIYSALVGFTDVVSMIQGKQQLQAELLQNFTQIWVNEWLSQWARGIHVDVVAFNFDPTKPPDFTITSQEFGQSKWGAFRLGYHVEAAPTPTDPMPWRLWVDYRMPEYRFLKNLSLSSDLDNKRNLGLNLQYKLEF
jgi:hypothetical protein